MQPARRPAQPASPRLLSFLARKVYCALEDRIKSARLWGHGVADGQNVHLDHVLHDKDIVELHG